MGKRIGRKIVYVTLIIVAFLLIDIFSRFLYAQSWFSSSTLKKEFDPFAIFSLVVTISVTLWLGWYVSKKVTEQRYEKDFMISEFKRIEEEINDLERCLLNSTIELQSILDILMNLKTHIDRSNMTADIFNVSGLIKKDEVNTYYSQLYKETTNSEGINIIVDDLVRNNISQICTHIILETRGNIFRINKH